jgi:hypothetical protein
MRRKQVSGRSIACASGGAPFVMTQAHAFARGSVSSIPPAHKAHKVVESGMQQSEWAAACVMPRARVCKQVSNDLLVASR